MVAFEPQGPIVVFVAATAAPTAAQLTQSGNLQSDQVMLTNVSSTVDAIIGWGQTSDTAKLNAVVGASPNQYYLLRGTQVVVSAKGPYFTGLTDGASTAAIKVQPGTGN